MKLTPGTRLGPYEILGPLGAGGMGRVFRARDVKLDRPVAIKILRDDCAHDPQWLARFEREARLLATLNHPNLATVHGLDEVDGSRFLVMELVPGQTLAQRLARGPLPADEALAVCKQVAAALEAAHEKGIIHRDLKPANVMLTPDGKVKILDFGLARSAEPPAGTADSTAPNEGQTEAGVLVGTPAYMAPEQARGRPLDRRCDLWAFGCVLYEALTGKQAFAGKTAADILAAVLERTPAWEALPAGLPPRVGALLRRCLQKDPLKRLRDAGDARLDIEEALAETAQGPPTPPPATSRRRTWLCWPVFAAAVALAALALGRWWTVATGGAPVGNEAAGEPPAAAGWSGQLLLGGTTRAYLPRLSPDGKWLAFLVIHEGQAQVGVLKLASGEWWVLTRNRQRGSVNSVCWSPDSNRLFFDRFFDVPAGVFSASPHDRAAGGAREVTVLKDADCPQVVADGSLIVGKLDADGNYQLHRYSPGAALRPVGPPLEFNRGWPAPVRALHARNAVVFCGKVLGKAPARRRFYLLDLDSNEYRPLAAETVQTELVPLAASPLAVSPRDDFACTVLPADDVFQVVRIPLAGNGPPQPLLTLTAPVWGLEVAADGRLYLDQVQRLLEVLRFDVPAQARAPAGLERPPLERLAAGLWRETETAGRPVELPDGRVVVPSKVAGRDRLLALLPGQEPTPLLEGSTEETAPPVALVGQRRLAFVAGSGKGRRLRLAALEEDGVRLEPVDLGVAGAGLVALAVAPDGKTLYYVQSRQVHAVPADGSRPPHKLVPGDGVAVHPATGGLLIQRFEKGGVRLFQLPRPGDPVTEVKVAPGPWRLAPLALGGRVIDPSGRVLVASVSRESWFWRPALLDAAGKLHPIRAAFAGDLYPAGWGKGGKALGMGYSLRSELWQVRLPQPADQGPRRHGNLLSIFPRQPAVFFGRMASGGRIMPGTNGRTPELFACCPLARSVVAQPGRGQAKGERPVSVPRHPRALPCSTVRASGCGPVGRPLHTC
jgi:hypothetical protein